MKKLFILCGILLYCLSTYAKVPATGKIRLIDNWEYLQGDLGGIWEAVRPASPGSPETVPLWQKVTLPHCFNAEDAVDPEKNYYQGPGWYKTLFTPDNPYTEGRTLLEFEGAGQKTEVYIYTTKVGEHTGGYDSWQVDITDAVRDFFADKKASDRFKGKVPLSIRCDNSRDLEMIPSDLSDFNVYGGIYRYLNLVYVPSVSFGNIQIEPQLSENRKKGSVKVSASFYNPSDRRKAEVTVNIYDPQQNKVYTETTSVLPLGKQALVDTEIAVPTLWHTDNPQLYTCEVTIRNGEESISAQERFGFRQVEFRKKGPFFLNGKRLLLRGTHRHEDHAGVGQAMTEEMMRTEMKMMKDMGVNFIRLGHYQQSEIILDLCDELGILVWEEIPWCRGGLGGEKYKEQARRMLTNMISQHRNHPSVIIWGLGNENDWPNDFSHFERSAIRAFMKELHDLSHALDDTRMTAIRRCEFCNDIVDVYSPSIWAGWYRGVFTDYKEISLNEMQKVDRFLHVEWGGDSHARRHSENVFDNLKDIQAGQGGDERAGDATMYGGPARASKDSDWSESYIIRLIDWHLKEQETMPMLTGTAYWPFKDFSTPVRPENPVPYVNQKGVVERDFTKKESYYVFQSYWTEEPMVHIYGHNWPVRWGEKEDLKEILVYSNCAEVELFVNGISQGMKKRNSQDFPAAGFHWHCKMKEGDNEIKAVGKKGKTLITDEIKQSYQTAVWGKEAAIKVELLPEEAMSDSVWIETQFVDAKGVPCLDSKKYITYDIAGDGKLIQNQGTSTGSRILQAFNGRTRIRVARNNGKSIVAVKAEDIPTVFIEL